MIYQQATILRQVRLHAASSLLLVLVALSAGCAASQPARQTEQSPRAVPVRQPRAASAETSSAHLAASIAANQVGVPYRYGGADRDGFDCSGLVYYAYSKAGVQLPRTTVGLWKSLKPVARDRLQAGDILFFDIEGKIAHVGLYIGKGSFVHAPSSGRHVVVANLNSGFYRHAFVRAGRDH